MISYRCTRREFSRALAASAACGVLGRSGLASPLPETAGFAFVASADASTSAADAIHVFQVSGSRWCAVQQLAVPAPAHLETHPTLPVLYAVHNVGLWNNLPRGAVSAYSVSPGTGHLTLRNAQPLSLSATHPRAAVVTPDGRHLFVAAERGGIYNVLEIDADGSLEPVTAIRKQVGLLEGDLAKSASPCHLVAHPDGTCVIAADAGQECVTVLTLDGEGIARDHVHTHAGAGPSHVALLPAGDMVLALDATSGSIATHHLNCSRLLSVASMYRPPVSGSALMAMHPSGRFLVTAMHGTLTCLRIDLGTGQLSRRVVISQDQPLSFITFAPDGTHLLGTVKGSGEILHIAMDVESGVMGRPHAVARVYGACSLLFRSA